MITTVKDINASMLNNDILSPVCGLAGDVLSCFAVTFGSGANGMGFSLIFARMPLTGAFTENIIASIKMNEILKTTFFFITIFSFQLQKFFYTCLFMHGNFTTNTNKSQQIFKSLKIIYRIY